MLRVATARREMFGRSAARVVVALAAGGGLDIARAEMVRAVPSTAFPRAGS